jgi:peptidyl-prolyl cis-trans isomerase A (cyclophilin A)
MRRSRLLVRRFQSALALTAALALLGCEPKSETSASRDGGAARPATAAAPTAPPAATSAPAAKPAAPPPAEGSAQGQTPSQPASSTPQAPPAADRAAAAPVPTPPPMEEPIVYVLMYTSKGEVLLELDRAKAPISVKNFLNYVDARFYHDTVFHRVMKNFMIQGGGFGSDGKPKPTSPAIKNEWQNGLKNKRGTIAMARTNVPDSATSQFFINLKENTSLDQPISGGAGYAVFGRVVMGMDIVDAIAATPVGPSAGGEMSSPLEPILLTEMRQLTAEQAKKRMDAKS